MQAGRESAYRKPALRPGNSHLAAIALRNPKDKGRYVNFSRTMIFGSIDPLLHYDISPRTLAELACEIVGPPIV